MAFARQASAAVVLVTLTLFLQCAGMAGLVVWARSHFERVLYKLGPLRSALLIVRFTTIIFVMHGMQILLWAWFYRWKVFPSWEFALYFSMASYSTVGAADLLLPGIWRIVGAVESVTGVLMCGLSISFVFTIMMRLVQRESRFRPELRWLTGRSPRDLQEK
jgi:voltage-gated potassium channel